MWTFSRRDQGCPWGRAGALLGAGPRAARVRVRRWSRSRRPRRRPGGPGLAVPPGACPGPEWVAPTRALSHPESGGWASRPRGRPRAQGEPTRPHGARTPRSEAEPAPGGAEETWGSDSSGAGLGAWGWGAGMARLGCPFGVGAFNAPPSALAVSPPGSWYPAHGGGRPLLCPLCRNEPGRPPLHAGLRPGARAEATGCFHSFSRDHGRRGWGWGWGMGAPGHADARVQPDTLRVGSPSPASGRGQAREAGCQAAARAPSCLSLPWVWGAPCGPPGAHCGPRELGCAESQAGRPGGCGSGDTRSAWHPPRTRLRPHPAAVSGSRWGCPWGARCQFLLHLVFLQLLSSREK